MKKVLKKEWGWRRFCKEHWKTILQFGIILVFAMSSAVYTGTLSDSRQDKKVKKSDEEKNKKVIQSSSDSMTGPLGAPTLEVTHDTGDSDGMVTVEVSDPHQLTGHDYQVSFHWSETEGDYVWNLDDITSSTSILSDQIQDGNSRTVDGFKITVTFATGYYD